ncbi:MAG: rhomboid family intramembrane serine protease [Desulfovibrio sp.]|uniref:rhomboid family intramembrane serine protease n=1 Tax=Desulfovibrio sp. 7SRBS1 TaxID=3378064 RepID=UPI003B3F46FF
MFRRTPVVRSEYRGRSRSREDSPGLLRKPARGAGQNHPQQPMNEPDNPTTPQPQNKSMGHSSGEVWIDLPISPHGEECGARSYRNGGDEDGGCGGMQSVNLPMGLPMELANEWSLVLQSRGLDHYIGRTPKGWTVAVPQADLDRALAEISAYERENRPRRRAELRREFAGSARATLLVLALLFLFHSLTGAVLPSLGLYPHIWMNQGIADSQAILHGEWWRAVTALTLHGDMAHIAGNILIGGVFIVFVCRETGSGLGWALVILCGVLGNLVNAWAHGPGHHSIGFSTSVFGAAGMLGAMRAVLGPGMHGRARWVPVGAAVGLLALLGLGGKNTDIGAHVFGFGLGLLFGLVAGWLLRRGTPGRAVQTVLGVSTALLVVGAWAKALGII